MSDSTAATGGEPVASDGVSRRQLLQTAAVGVGTVMAGGVLAACSSGANDGAGTSTTAGRTGEVAKKGGRLRVGVPGGGPQETLDFNHSLGDMDLARAVNLFEGLTDTDKDGKTVMLLAEEMEPNADASKWTIRVRDDVISHDGGKFGADDVIFSLRYMLDPKNKANGAGTLSSLDPNGIRKVDARTVELTLKAPNSYLPTVMTDRTVKMFRANTGFDKPVGTGPFKFESWKRGERSLFVRHDEYRDGLPYVDELELISVNDPNSRVSALQSKQIDALAQLDLTLVDALSNDQSLQILETVGANHTALMVEVVTSPFDDNDVRQALRYATDRKQMIDNTLQGKGRIGNDLPAFFDPDYAGDIPQREHDPEKARFLLKKAGKDGLRVTLHTSDVAPAMLESSTLFVEQAKEAGLQVELKRYPTAEFYATTYLKVPFAGTNWGGRPLASHINVAYLKDSPFNENKMHFPDFEKIVNKAFATTDETARRQMMVDAQQILWDRGGTVTWGFLPIIDALAANVRGIDSSVIRSLGNYDFRRAWLAS